MITVKIYFFSKIVFFKLCKKNIFQYVNSQFLKELVYLTLSGSPDTVAGICIYQRKLKIYKRSIIQKNIIIMVLIIEQTYLWVYTHDGSNIVGRLIYGHIITMGFFGAMFRIQAAIVHYLCFNFCNSRLCCIV